MADTGSWVMVSRRLLPYTQIGIEEWCGLSADFDLVPHTGCTGSTAYCIDTGQRYMYEETTDAWYPMPSSGSGGGGGSLPDGYTQYAGSYSVTPAAASPQILLTANKLLQNNVTVAKIPYTEVDNPSEGVTVSIAS